MVLCVTKNGTAQHTGSTVVGPVASTFNSVSPSFCKIEGVEMMSSEDTIDTPTHQYVTSPPAFHSHSAQIVNNRQQSFVKIEGNAVLLVGDVSTANTTTINNAGQTFVGVA